MVRIHTVLTATLVAFVALAVQARHHHATADRSGQAGTFDYYVWPQYDSGGYPENCATQFMLSADAADKGRTLYPSERLMQHEWKEHGTCSGLDARMYFNMADRAIAVVKIPAALEAPHSDQRLTAERIVNLFYSVNPKLSENAMAVACNRSELSEVRVCLTRDLEPRSCGRGVHSNCPGVAFDIPASR